MKGAYKEFDPKLYAKWDDPAKQAVADHLMLNGHTVTVPPEDYGPDLYSFYCHRKCYHEVEVRRYWWPPDTFKWPYGSLPSRKKRLTTKVGECELFFWMLRNDFQRALVYAAIDMVRDEYLVEVPNDFIKKGEYFYRPPYNLGKEFNLAFIGNGQNHSSL